MMHRVAIVFACACVLASPALAALDIQSVPVRKGVYAATDCVAEVNPQLYNECLCDADVAKAEVRGLEPKIMKAINASLALVPEQLANESCEGKQAVAPASGITINQTKADYKIAYESASILSMLINYSTYGAGAAHALYGTESLTFDLTDGKLVQPLSNLSAEQLAKANGVLVAELAKKYGDALFEETKARADPFLSEAGCDTCTMYFSKDGWAVRFQLYAIAPYSTGEPEVTLPLEVIAAPETLTAKK